MSREDILKEAWLAKYPDQKWDQSHMKRTYGDVIEKAMISFADQQTSSLMKQLEEYKHDLGNVKTVALQLTELSEGLIKERNELKNTLNKINEAYLYWVNERLHTTLFSTKLNLLLNPTT